MGEVRAALSPCRRSILTLSCRMPAQRNRPKRDNFNTAASLPFQLRLEDFEIAMQDVYDLFHDINTGLLEKGLERLDDFLRPAIMSGFLSDLLTASLSKPSNFRHCRSARPVRERLRNRIPHGTGLALCFRFRVGVFQCCTLDVLTSLVQ